MSNALIIFIKNPEKGKVKTRLAETMGADNALKIYLALLRRTRRIVRKVDAVRLLFYSSYIDYADAWPESHFEKFLQSGADLGARMDRAFHLALDRYDSAVIIGSDCANLTAEILQEAFRQLESHDFVIGPAEDGGYYLLGMKKPAPPLFHEMTWSTSTVYHETVERIENMRKSYYVLPTLSDIDYEEDWKKYGWEID